MSRKMNVSAISMTPPVWVGRGIEPYDLIPAGAKLDASAFMAPDGARVTLTANSAVDDTTLDVAALANPIPSGTLLDFGGKKLAITAADAAAGAITITVRAVPTALVTGDVAIYTGAMVKSIPAGTVVGRTYAERDAETAMGPAADTDDEVYLLAFTIDNVDDDNDATLLHGKRGMVVKENFLPNWTTLSAAIKAKLRAQFVTTIGVA
jgi:hypothetical protein